MSLIATVTVTPALSKKKGEKLLLCGKAKAVVVWQSKGIVPTPRVCGNADASQSPRDAHVGHRSSGWPQSVAAVSGGGLGGRGGVPM